jgi:hypothetical protein
MRTGLICAERRVGADAVQSVPDQHHRSLLFELVQLGGKFDQGLIVVGTSRGSDNH